MRAGYKKQMGVTLVELMVAATLGLLISSGIGAVFVQGSRSHSEDDRYLRMIESGRYAINVIANDLRMISFWGEMLDPGGIGSALTAGEDCGLDLFDGAAPVSTNNPHASPALVQFDIASGTCASLTGTVRTGTNQLALKHTSGLSVTTGQTNNTVYVRSNGATANFVQYVSGTTAAPSANFADWTYLPRMYYIRDDAGTPYLCRLQLNGLGFAATTVDECLAEGVEQFHVQFGIDTDADGVANQYKSDPAAAEMDNAVTARVYVLVRSMTPDPHRANPKAYALGDLAIAAAGDNFYRRVFSTTVQLRNPANLAVLN